jgi:hypothetical protein
MSENKTHKEYNGILDVKLTSIVPLLTSTFSKKVAPFPPVDTSEAPPTFEACKSEIRRVPPSLEKAVPIVPSSIVLPNTCNVKGVPFARFCDVAKVLEKPYIHKFNWKIR